MIGFLKRWIDDVRGQGHAAPTVPPMDGALHPNDGIDTAHAVLGIASPDNLAVLGDGLIFSSGSAVFRLAAGAANAEKLRDFDSPISCLATHGTTLAVGLENGEIHLQSGDTTPSEKALARLSCPTAMAFADGNALLICDGSATLPPRQWKCDLMQRGSSGRVVSIDVSSGRLTTLAGGLAYPLGLAITGSGIVVSEAWRSRLVQLGNGAPTPLLSDLPGYPSRIAPARDKGYWLSVFAPRNQLIELVLREDAYRKRMMTELAEEHWVAPSLAAAKSYLEPLQGGAIRTHGIIKPWAPTRSYGLLVRLGEDFRPCASWHSRADGTRHGITSSVETAEGIFFTSKGGDEILRLAQAETGEVVL